MKQSHLGLFAIIASLFTWFILIGLRFDYLVNEVYQRDPGEPLWVLDGLFFLIVTVSAGFIALLGLLAIVGEKFQKQ
ncbi:MAG: hypothetical protein ACFFFC_13185 [Candidatus Thorarchaeota archaeon]